MDRTLYEGAAAIGIELTRDQHDKLLMHLDILDEWSARMNLTAIRDRPSQITRHLLDSLSVQPWLHGYDCADVGSGAGFPGIPLAIVATDRHFSLIESTGKKARFLSHACEALNLGNVTVVNTRAEQYRPPRPFSTVVARAVGPVAQLAEFSRSLVFAGGTLLAMKGRLPEAEVSGRLDGWQRAGLHRLTVPGLDEERHLVELRRTRDKSR